MQSLLLASWNRIEPELRSRAGDAVFDAWLRDLRPLALERGVMHLEAKNRLICERVRQMYLGLIAECLSNEFGTAISVEVQPLPEIVSGELEVSPGKPVIDASNRTAFLALKSLLEKRDLPSNLFLFYGVAGTGKSFLLEWWRGLRGRTCRVFTAAQLTKTYQACFRDRRVSELRRDLASQRPLIVEEVHRLAGRERIGEEFASVLELRSKVDAPTLLSSRWHPREIWRISARLQTWLGSGMVTRLDLPGPNARLSYLRALEGPPSRNGRATMVEDLAREMKASYPDLRRAWALRRQGRRSGYWQLIDPRTCFERVSQRVSGAFDVSVEDLVGTSQRRRISMARKVLAWLCVQEGLSRAEVGRFTGNRTRAAISYAIKSLDQRMADEPELRRQIESLS